MNWTEVGMGCIKAALDSLKEIEEVKALNKEINIQTNADIASHKAIISHLKENKIKCNVYSEEEKELIKINGGDAKTVFIVDPIDNTHLLLRGEISFCSVALMIIINGSPEFSLIGDLSNGNIYHCDEKYVYKNNVKINLKKKVEGRGVILGWAPYKMRMERLFNNLTDLSEKKYYIYNFGGQLQTAKIIDGTYDAYIEVRAETLNEFCAALIVKRAGGIISTLQGKPIEWNPNRKQTLIVARNKEVYNDILAKFKNKDYEN